MARIADVQELRRRLRPAPPLPWRDGNRFRLLNDGTEFYARMLEAIGEANDHVLLEMYLVESGQVSNRFISAMLDAVSRGVRVAALFDGFGALGLRADDRQRLTEGGVELRFYNALGWRKRLGNLLRNHRKLLLVDGAVAFVGGAGLTDAFAGTRPVDAWRDLMVEIQGPVVADWQSVFAGTWRKTGGGPAPRSEPLPGLPDGARGRVATSAGWHYSELSRSVIEHIHTARRRAWVTSAYFVPSRRFRKALRKAARRGVDVRLLAPGPKTDHPVVRHAARRFFGKMLYNDVRIFEFQPRVLHAKMVLCDDWVSIGSSNLDRWSFKWNLEANQEIDDSGFASLAAAVFERDCEQSEELEVRAWPRRGRINRLWENIAGALDRTLERWRRPRLP
jgi:phosphatidylserine/phosphatidylglycerophosphate/cardiolipin synthase-like enzyme